MTIEQKLGMQIRKSREKLNISQEKLAEKAGLSSDYIGKLERGEALGKISSYADISKALGEEFQINIGDDQLKDLGQIPGLKLYIERVPMLDSFYQEKLEKQLEQLIETYIDIQKEKK